MSDISVFSFGSSVVRTTTDSTGGIWFCAMDVSSCLDHTNGRKMIEILDKDEVTVVYVIDAVGRHQQVSFISESGLYEVLFKSTLPKAKPFQQWLSKEVLPSIRKTGKEQPLNMELLVGTSVGLSCVNAIDARQLWGSLEVSTPFGMWIQRRLEECQAQECVDFSTTQKSAVDITDKFQKKDYILSLDIAKHISMLERTDIGRKVRQYFIDIEKQLTVNYSDDAAVDTLLIAMTDTRKRIKEVARTIALHGTRLTTTESRVDVVENRQSNQDCFNGESRLTAVQVSELDSEMHKKFLAMGRNTLAASVLKKQIKQKWLTPPLTTKTYKDCASKDFPEIIKFVKTFRFGGR